MFPVFSDFEKGKEKILISGLGYVGLPLLIALSKKFKVIGFDINEERIAELKKGYDRNGEIRKEELKNSNIEFTNNENSIRNGRLIIIAVPTPVDEHNIPNIDILRFATGQVARNMVKGSLVVYESTVYPGLTEEVCVPMLAKLSDGFLGKDFKVGYSPERINPGDKEHTIYNVTKIVSASDSDALELLYKIYGSVIRNIHKTPSIKTAEAAKVIENTQRDLNIALMNELSIIFNKIGIDTKEVLDAASTKWNFLKFEPGLVGGHCIGVDPYYLTYKAQELGYHPNIILSGRKINDYMGKYVAEETVKELIKSDKLIKGAKILILGFTFKETINDIRNTKVMDIYNELREYGIRVYIYDPYVDKLKVREAYNISLLGKPDDYIPYDGIIVSVKHREFLKFNMVNEYKKWVNENPILMDIKGIYDKCDVENIGFSYWRL